MTGTLWRAGTCTAVAYRTCMASTPRPEYNLTPLCLDDVQSCTGTAATGTLQHAAARTERLE